MMRIMSFFVFVGVLALVNKGYCQIHKIDSLSKALQSSSNNEVKVNILASMSELYIRIDFRKAVEYAELALQSASTNKTAKAAALTNRALVYWYNGEYANSIKLNNEAILLHQELQDSEGIAYNYQKMAMNYYYKADYEDAIYYHQLSLKEFRKFDNPRQIASALNQIALVYNKMGEYNKAAQFLYEFSAERMQFEGYQGRTYNLVESTPFFRSKEYFQIELELQLKALSEMEEHDDGLDILFTCLNIADSYRELGNKEMVLRYLKKADEYYSKVGWMSNYYGLGNAYLNLGLLDSAIFEFQSGIRVAEERGTKITLMAAHQGLGKALQKKGNLDEAHKKLKIGLEMTTEMGNKLDIILMKHEIIGIDMQLNSWGEALALCDESIELAKKIRVKRQEAQGLQLKSEILRSVGNYEQALKLFEEAKIISDSLMSGEADFQFAQMQAQLELDKKTRDIEQLNLEKGMQEATIRNKDLLIIGFIIVLALSILLAVSTFLRYRQKIKANEILQKQKRQIEMLLSEVHHRVKNNLQVISSLLSIQSDQLLDSNARMAVLEGQSRVQAMGLIHENIYRSENFAFINMGEYIKKMVSNLADSFGLDDQQLQLSVEANEISLDVDTAILVGLIINELATNSLKHAFNNIDHPQIWIKLYLEGNMLALEVKDNGKGMLVPSNQNSFGLKLVTELASQMDGTVEFSQEDGFSVSVKFTKFKLAA